MACSQTGILLMAILSTILFLGVFTDLFYAHGPFEFHKHLVTHQQLYSVLGTNTNTEKIKHETRAPSTPHEHSTVTNLHIPPQVSAFVASLSKQTAWETLKGEPFPHGMKRKCVIGPFFNDWKHLEHLIMETDVPFAIARYGDGERNLIMGKAVDQNTQAFDQDKFWFEGGNSELGDDLKWSLTGHFGHNYYYGFASPRDDGGGLTWYLQHTEQLCHFITYANIFVNSNYVHTKAMLLKLLERERVVVIANYESINTYLAQRNQSVPFRYLRLPDDAPHVYVGKQRQALIRNVTQLATSLQKHTFIVSGGPMAKPLIAHMWNANPNNQYVDFGSAVDEIMKGRITRPYMQGNSEYAQQVDPPFSVDDQDRVVIINYDFLPF